MKKIVIIGGGTVSHVRNHLSLSAHAYGTTARTMSEMFGYLTDPEEYQTVLALTRMADPANVSLETPEHVSELVDGLIADPEVRCVVFNVALVDFSGQVDDVPSGKYAERLRTDDGPAAMVLTPTEKIIGRIRKERKDIFVVGFKTTTGATPDEQYARAMRLLKTNSLNLVLANDTVTRMNLIAAPEETRYCQTVDRNEALLFLTKMTVSRMRNTFTRSTVVPGEAVPWTADEVPPALREVVDHCIRHGAYKRVLGKTAGHFAVRSADGEILTSIRKTDFNRLGEVGLVRVQSTGDDTVVAHGHKPSVGGQSQRIIFREHPELDCIVHFHCPPREDAPLLDKIPVRAQWPNECGSHQCGATTSGALSSVDLGGGDSLKVVYLDGHGPNIVFSRNTPAAKVRGFIDANFDLAAKTGGLAATGA